MAIAVRIALDEPHRLLEPDDERADQTAPWPGRPGSPGTGSTTNRAPRGRRRGTRIDAKQRRNGEQRERKEYEVDAPRPDHLGAELAHQAHRSQKADDERALPEGLVQAGTHVELLGEDLGDEGVGEHPGQAERSAVDVVGQDRAPHSEQYQYAQQAQGVAEHEERMVKLRTGREGGGFEIGVVGQAHAANP